MKTLFALALAISLAMASAHAGEFSLNGVEVGSTATAAAFASLGMDKDCKPSAGTVCRGYMKLGGHEVQSQVNVGADGRIAKIIVNFQHAFFEDIDSVCILSWGKPTSVGEQPMQNAYGAQVTAIERDWKSPHSTAAIMNYAAVMDKGMIVVALQ